MLSLSVRGDGTSTQHQLVFRLVAFDREGTLMQKFTQGHGFQIRVSEEMHRVPWGSRSGCVSGHCRGKAAPKTLLAPRPTPTTKVGDLWEIIFFLCHFRRFLLKGYFFPSLVSCPQSTSSPFGSEGIQALGPLGRSVQPSPLGAHFTGGNKDDIIYRGMKVINLKSEFEIDDLP